MIETASILAKYPILDDVEVPDDVMESWQITADLLAQIANIPAALIMRAHDDEIEVCISSHSPGNVYHQGEKADLDTGLYCETVMSTQQKLLVPNALSDPAWCNNPDVKLGMISYCGLPLNWPSGEVFGTICILDTKENKYSQKTYDLMERFRDSIQLSLEIITTLAWLIASVIKREMPYAITKHCFVRCLKMPQWVLHKCLLMVIFCKLTVNTAALLATAKKKYWQVIFHFKTLPSLKICPEIWSM